MAAQTSSKKPRIRPVMNVTPLVDVVLVLLIIFMIVVPMMDQNVRLTLPSIENIDAEGRGRADPFTLSVTHDGGFYFEKFRMRPGDLERSLREANQREPRRRLVLRSDQDVPYGAVRRLFNLCQKIGFPGVSLQVNQREASRPAAS